MDHQLLLSKENLLDKRDLLKDKDTYKSALVEYFSRIRELKNLQKVIADKTITDEDFYNEHYKGVYAIDYNNFIDMYKETLFKDPKEQILPVQVAVHCCQAQGRSKATDTYDKRYWVNLRVFTEQNFKLEDKIYTVEEVETLIKSGQIFSTNWYTGKEATDEDFKKYNSFKKLSTLYFDKQKQYSQSQDFSQLSLYTHTYEIIRKSLPIKQINEDIGSFINRFEEELKTITKKQEKAKETSIKRNYYKRLKQNEEILSLSSEAMNSLKTLEK